MTSTRVQELLEQTAGLLALGDIDSLSMRSLGDKVGIKQSVIYHYFQNKDDLLFKTFLYCTQKLGESLARLPTDVMNAQDMLRQRIEYQFDNADFIVALLKYFMGNPDKFQGQPGIGKVPPQAYRHITEVLERGVKEGLFHIDDIAADAKTITHAINGFILEYYPDVPTDKERQELITKIHGFILRALT